MEDVWVSDKSNLLSISHGVVSFSIIDFENAANRPSAWSDLLGGGCAGVSLVSSIDLVSHVENHKSIGLFVHEHHIVTESQLPIMAVSLWDSLETLGEFLLCLVDH